MSNCKSNFPSAQLGNINKVDIRAMVKDIRCLYLLGRPKTDDEVEERINEYFSICEKTSIRPGIESLCMSLHISRMTLFNWANGIKCSERRQQLAEEAKTFIIAFLEQATLSGRLNPASSCFLFKNWAGYSDSISFENKTMKTDDILPELSVKEIAARHRRALENGNEVF